MTFRWIEQVVEIARFDHPVLLEGQMRIAFIRDALAQYGREDGRIILVDCEDIVRMARLARDRIQPELATSGMLQWSLYLRQEATETGCEILNTGRTPFTECVAIILHHLNQSHRDT